MNILEKVLEEIKDLKEKQNSSNQDYATGYLSALSTVEGIISGVKENDGWIPVEERLPEEETEVLCCFENGTVQSLWQNWKNDGLGDYLDNDLNLTQVIAWKNLPEPYKPEEN